MIFYPIGYLLTKPQISLCFSVVTPTLVSDWESSDVSAEHEVFPDDTETIAWAPFHSYPTLRSLPGWEYPLDHLVYVCVAPAGEEENDLGGRLLRGCHSRVSRALCRGRSRVPLTLCGLY